MNINPSTLTRARESASTFNYKAELIRAMEVLAEDERTVFLGQGVEDPGTFMSQTLKTVPNEKKIELPVAEEMQAGMAIGFWLKGLVPVCVYPRFNFALLAMNQLVNHIDKMKAHVIIRVGVGSEKPLHPGPQHTGDMTYAFRDLMPNTMVRKFYRAQDIVPQYRIALNFEGPTLLVEFADFYAG